MPRSTTKTLKTSSSPSASNITFRVALDLAHRHGISKLDVRPDGFTIEFMEHAHVKQGKEVGVEFDENEAVRELTDKEIFHAAG
jgi:hypothetical protein